MYTKHLECASLWPNCWQFIQIIIDNKLQTEIEAHYDYLNKKLDKLLEKQNIHTMHTPHKQQQCFYPRTINLTNIKFTKEELALLDHGMQYSMQKPLKSYWTNLIMETVKAIKLMDGRIQNAFRIMATKKLRQMYISNDNVNTPHTR